jgi:hypothetical protein
MGTIAAKFEAVAGMEHVVGCIDGSHLPVLADVSDKMYYINRKGWASIVLHACVGSDGQFLHVDIGSVGSCHDARVFSTSNLGKALVSTPPEQRAVPHGCYLLGDSAYPSTPFLLTPFDVARGAIQENYNYVHARTRVKVEQTFGCFKSKWRLFNTARCLPRKTADLAFAATALHNVAVMFHDNYDNEMPEISEEAFIRRASEASRSIPSETAEYGTREQRERGREMREIVAKSLPRLQRRQR